MVAKSPNLSLTLPASDINHPGVSERLVNRGSYGDVTKSETLTNIIHCGYHLSGKKKEKLVTRHG